jgi:proteasome component ECM29
MANIWNVLVTDSKATMAKYYGPIMADLLANISNKQWRVRESCCNALCDILGGHTWAELGPSVAAPAITIDHGERK